ncbi:MAG TPA: DUF2795 domain-containing protein [Chloroflexota bacterium]|jgi:hypothetical protein
MTMHETHASPGSVREYLEDLTYPAGKQSLIERARARGAPAEVLRALESIPDREYGGLKEVTAAVGGNIPPAPTAGARHDGTEAGRPADPGMGADDPAKRPLGEKPHVAPGGIAGRASDREREDPVVLASDDSFPASDPPAH